MIAKRLWLKPAAKRSDCEAREGVVKVAVSEDAKTGYIMEINAETDFVTRSEKFQEFAQGALNLVMAKQPISLAELMALPYADGTVQDSLSGLSGVIGEKLDIKRYDILTSDGTVAAYSHAGGKIGVLATPILVTLLETAALQAVERLMPAGQQTVGTRLEISHTAATPVGMRVCQSGNC